MNNNDILAQAIIDHQIPTLNPITTTAAAAAASPIPPPPPSVPSPLTLSNTGFNDPSNFYLHDQFLASPLPDLSIFPHGQPFPPPQQQQPLQQQPPQPQPQPISSFLQQQLPLPPPPNQQQQQQPQPPSRQQTLPPVPPAVHTPPVGQVLYPQPYSVAVENISDNEMSDNNNGNNSSDSDSDVEMSDNENPTYTTYRNSSSSPSPSSSKRGRRGRGGRGRGKNCPSTSTGKKKSQNKENNVKKKTKKKKGTNVGLGKGKRIKVLTDKQKKEIKNTVGESVKQARAPKKIPLKSLSIVDPNTNERIENTTVDCHIKPGTTAIRQFLMGVAKMGQDEIVEVGKDFSAILLKYMK